MNDRRGTIMNVKQVHIPENVEYILKTLNDNGYEAFAVGGCVRDCLLGREPGDWDITTNARPETVMQLFAKTVETGLKHGTVTVLMGGESFEVTTYRIDGEYLDSRRPESVEYAATLQEDLARRDFTVNAMAYHPTHGLVDLHGGLKDLRHRILRTVGDPDCRFGEDALRMLRAVRFSAQLDFRLEDGVVRSLQRNNSLIRHISHERVREELNRILLSDNPVKLILLRDTGLLQYIMPELEICFHTQQNNPYHVYNVGIHTLQAVASIEKNLVLRWVMLLHDIGKPSVRTTDAKGIDHFYGHPFKSVQLAQIILQRLRFDNHTKNRILKLVEKHDRRVLPNPKAVRKAAAAIGEELFEDLLKVQEADMRAQNPEYLSTRLEALETVRKIYEEIKVQNQCFSIKNLQINGHDLIAIGFQQGREIRTILERLLEAVIENPDINTKEQLLALAAQKSWRRNSESHGKWKTTAGES